ncbi:bifunctional S-adenosyl-L-methionine-dependent methyltransferase superfamily/SAM-dependent methyltransferase RsmB-NOP2-type/RNA (C5-cytosine) methyltransferase [Babesia duncani]|uniref:NOL1/NOP2/Sun domain family member 4 n=1 Tax=Babesia duncani TaxID=323732 RepID=A0AAD9PLL9_9APIC|nr:bifunctional S-adenosyl-L-methionine-dependent methyltransferase superfamily/SAM-dependent methyltransferase RsmB-NOP2-type/RNA (C5-cytosine) methyltransferase [Babesia duncani]
MKSAGKSGFESHFSALYKQRWKALYAAMHEPTLQTLLIPPFWSEIPDQENPEEVVEPLVTLQDMYLPWCFKIENGHESNVMKNELERSVFDANSRVTTLKQCCFYTDFGAAFGAFCLGVLPGDRVLDLITNNGAKSLIFASCLFQEYKNTLHGISNASEKSTSEIVNLLNTKSHTKNGPGLLVINESNKVTSTLRKLLPERLFTSGSIQMVNYNIKEASKFNRFGKFDKIFVHAPTSNESKMIQRQDFGKWIESNHKSNANHALEILNDFIRHLKPGGTMVYYSNSIHSYENELVVHSFLEQHENVQIVKITHGMLSNYFSQIHRQEMKSDCLRVEIRRFGVALMPDKEIGGPAFICKFTLKRHE